MPQCLKLSEIKTNITQIIVNLQNLENLCNGPSNDFTLEQSLQLQQNTDSLLSGLAELPCEQVARIQGQRRRRRQRAKQKAKLQKIVNKATAKNAKQAADCSMPAADTAPPCPKVLHQQEQQHFMQKKLHDATNILYTFDLLERLYKVRGGENKTELARKLQQMRTAWRGVQLESRTQTASQDDVGNNLELQWDRIIFGGSTVPMKQLSRRHKKQHTKEILQRRTIWDSHITDGKHGSCIPSGWVLPPKNPSPEWAAFKCE